MSTETSPDTPVCGKTKNKGGGIYYSSAINTGEKLYLHFLFDNFPIYIYNSNMNSFTKLVHIFFNEKKKNERKIRKDIF